GRGLGRTPRRVWRAVTGKDGCRAAPRPSQLPEPQGGNDERKTIPNFGACAATDRLLTCVSQGRRSRRHQRRRPFNRQGGSWRSHGGSSVAERSSSLEEFMQQDTEVGNARPLLRARLQPPRPPSTPIPRPELFDRLHAGLDRALTLISAPAGSGKTT